jgi:hypothetical protein
MLCDECGAKIDDGSRFCGECGAPARSKTRELGLEQGPVSVRAKTGQGRTTRTREQRRDARSGPSAIKTTFVGVAPDDGGGKAPKPPKPPRYDLDDERTNPALDPATKKRIEALAKAAREADDTGAEVTAEPTEFQRLLDEVESGFEAILGGASKPDDPALAPTAENVFDEQQAKELFHQLVVANARDIRDFLIELRLGEPSAAWLDYVRPSIRAILRSAEGMGHAELVTRLRAFADALDEAKTIAQGLLERAPAPGEAWPPLRDPLRQKLMDAYGELVVFLPEAFALEAESQRREAAIVAALFEQELGERGLALERLRGSGLSSLGLLYVLRPQDLTEQTRIEPQLAESLVARLTAYRAEVARLAPDGARAEERGRLAEAVAELERAHQAYDEAEPCSVARRAARKRRRAALADARLWLARLGRTEDAARLEPLSFDAKLDLLEEALEELERRAAGQLPGRIVGGAGR